MNSVTPYRKIEYFGYVLGGTCLVMLVTEIIKLLD